MSDRMLFARKYRIPSARLHGWDYADEGMYFATICTKDRVRWFGNVINGKMQLSDVGRIVADEWLRMGRRYRDVIPLRVLIATNGTKIILAILRMRKRYAAREEYVFGEWIVAFTMQVGMTLDEWIVMPDHVHGIVIINPPCTCQDADCERSRRPADVADNALDQLQKNVCNIGGASLQSSPPRGVSNTQQTHNPYRHPEWQSGCLGAMIDQCKSRCTKRIWKMGYADFAWQPRFHDHIMRNDRALERIRKYIRENPIKWDGS